MNFFVLQASKNDWLDLSFFPESQKSPKEKILRREVRKAEISLLKIIQKESFSGENEKRVKNFNVMTDSNGIFRIKTRLPMRNDKRNFRFPILLPNDRIVVEMLIRARH